MIKKETPKLQIWNYYNWTKTQLKNEAHTLHAISDHQCYRGLHILKGIKESIKIMCALTKYELKILKFGRHNI